MVVVVGIDEGRARERTRRQELGAGEVAECPSGVELVRIRERQRLAMELHASVAQLLFAVGAEARIALGTDDATARERGLQSILELAGEARSELYETLTFLNRVPPSRSLHALLDGEVRAFEAATGITANLLCSGDPVALGDVKEDVLFETLSEALRNIRKHAVARTSRVVANLAYDARCVTLTVHNDGGASAQTPAVPAERPHLRGCLGLLADRAQQLRGALDVRLFEDGGAMLTVRLPRAAIE